MRGLNHSNKVNWGIKKCVISHTTVVSIFLCNWVYLVELGMNNKKTKIIAENVENPEIRTLDGTVLEVVKDFNYLGAWIASTQNDIRIRRARA